MKRFHTLLLGVAVSILLGAVARAENTCPAASAISRGGGMPRDLMSRIEAACRTGDRVSLDASQIELIMLACDSTQPTINLGRDVMCTLGRNAASRR